MCHQTEVLSAQSKPAEVWDLRRQAQVANLRLCATECTLRIAVSCIGRDSDHPTQAGSGRLNASVAIASLSWWTVVTDSGRILLGQLATTTSGGRIGCLVHSL